MAARQDAELRLPPGLSAQEEAEWWDRHQDYWDTPGGTEEMVEPVRVRRSRPLSVHLPETQRDALEREAARHSVPAATLAQRWIAERLERLPADN
jgi:hypothetical protein